MPSPANTSTDAVVAMIDLEIANLFNHASAVASDIDTLNKARSLILTGEASEVTHVITPATKPREPAPYEALANLEQAVKGLNLNAGLHPHGSDLWDTLHCAARLIGKVHAQAYSHAQANGGEPATDRELELLRQAQADINRVANLWDRG